MKTEKFLAFLNKETQPKITHAIWKKDQENTAPKPVFNKGNITNEHQWTNRFSKIKTTFESPVQKNEKKKEEKTPMSSAREFWKTADDSVAVVKSNKENIAAANGARLSRQGSIFLKKLFQQKEKEMEEKPPGKLPWTGANNENVVVGSLTVYNQKPKIFSPVENVAPVTKPLPQKINPLPQKINQFSHAPMSAFRPVERKVDMEVQKICNGKINSYNKPTPLSPPLPWTKDNSKCTSLTSTVAKFEPREPSPILIMPKRQEPSPVRSISRSPSQPSIVQARSQTFTPTYPNITLNQNLAPQNYNSYPTTYSADVAATTTIYHEPEYEPSTPEEQIAIAKVMASPIQQQAVMIKQKTHRRDEEEEGRSSAAGHLANVLQRFSTPPEDKEDSPKGGLSGRNSLTDSSIPKATLLPPKLPTGKTSPTQIYNAISPRNIYDKKIYVERLPSASSRRTSSVESLVTTTSSEELRENGESVLTTRLQIPVYTPSNRTSSVQDLSPRNSPRDSPRDSPSMSPTLRKSESWHQLNGQMKPKRPQSLILPDLPTPQRRTPTLLSKAKSSHALGFAGKQFEATMTPATVEIKQKTVEEYLSVKKTKTKKEVKLPQPQLVELDDNLENVDEAFDALFNSVTGKKGKRKSSDLITNSSVSAFNRTSAANLSKSTSASAVQHFRSSK